MKLALSRRNAFFGSIFATGAATFLIAAFTSGTLAERWDRDKFDSREVCEVRDRSATPLFDAAWWYRHDTRLELWYRDKFRRMSPFEQIHLTVDSR